jgi:3-deoxy-7-phosphoheptulonate synthase
MIIQLNNNIDSNSLNLIENKLKEHNLKGNYIKTQHGQYLVAIGKEHPDMRVFKNMKGINDIHKVSDDYKLVSHKWKLNNSEVDLGDNVKIGNGNFAIMAGPCSIESEENIKQTVEHLVKNNIKIMRGGVFKPRSSPYSFRGLGIDGLKMFYKTCKENGIKIITEVMQVSQIEEMEEFVDIFQVGARNSQNFNLLDELGKSKKAVLLKRGVSGSIDELLQGAEYIFSNGNENIMLCERGIRSFENAYRNTFDINAIAILKEKTHLPVIADPSHGIGIRDHVSKIAMAATIAGADGIIVEVHPQPEIAYSDGFQNLNFEEAEKLYTNLNTIRDLAL